MARFSNGPLAGTEKDLPEDRWLCSIHEKPDSCHGIIAHSSLLATSYSERRQCWIYVWARYDVFIRTSRYGPNVAEAIFLHNYTTLHAHDAYENGRECKCGREPGF